MATDFPTHWFAQRRVYVDFVSSQKSLAQPLQSLDGIIGQFGAAPLISCPGLWQSSALSIRHSLARPLCMIAFLSRSVQAQQLLCSCLFPALTVPSAAFPSPLQTDILSRTNLDKARFTESPHHRQPRPYDNPALPGMRRFKAAVWPMGSAGATLTFS
jgi:hypothetical protein